MLLTDGEDFCHAFFWYRYSKPAHHRFLGLDAYRLSVQSTRAQRRQTMLVTFYPFHSGFRCHLLLHRTLLQAQSSGSIPLLSKQDQSNLPILGLHAIILLYAAFQITTTAATATAAISSLSLHRLHSRLQGAKPCTPGAPNAFRTKRSIPTLRTPISRTRIRANNGLISRDGTAPARTIIALKREGGPGTRYCLFQSRLLF